eukprot:Sspe_Gene.72676::Locus_43490_Transcript_1_1_Confidence_1.000_Length_874::g.72676::m.72676
MNCTRCVGIMCYMTGFGVWLAFSLAYLFIPDLNRVLHYKEAMCRISSVRLIRQPADAYLASYVITILHTSFPPTTWQEFCNAADCPGSCAAVNLKCAQDFLGDFQEGDVRRCWYNPSSPSEVKFSNSISTSHIVEIVIPSLFLLLGLVFVLYLLRQRRALRYEELPLINADSPVEYLRPNGKGGFVTSSNEPFEVYEAGTPRGVHCVVCMDEMKNVAFTPCHHMCTCYVCAVRLKKCPLCRETVTSCLLLWEGENTPPNTPPDPTGLRPVTPPAPSTLP